MTTNENERQRQQVVTTKTIPHPTIRSSFRSSELIRDNDTIRNNQILLLLSHGLGSSTILNNQLLVTPERNKGNNTTTILN